MEGFISGSFSGLVQIIVGHPLDTYKIWLQNSEKNKNLKHLYRGIQYPLYTNCLINSVLFGTNNLASKYISNPWITGFITGIATSFICTPVELFKIRRQCYLPPPNNWFLGYRATLMRETIGCSLYIGIYDYLYQKKKYSCLFSGGVAGISCWFLTHPIDTIKTRIQTGQTSNIIKGFTEKGLWNGLTHTLVRAFLVNSIGFWVYQKSNDFINNI